MIKIEDVSKSFGKLKALDSINLELNKGECVALIGPNGSGKTTLLKCILGMVFPDKGQILFNDTNIVKDWRYKSKVGYMPQIGRYPDNMTIGQLITMIRDIRQKENPEQDNELYQSFEIESILNKRMRTLSGGTRQKERGIDPQTGQGADSARLGLPRPGGHPSAPRRTAALLVDAAKPVLIPDRGYRIERYGEEVTLLYRGDCESLDSKIRNQ